MKLIEVLNKIISEIGLGSESMSPYKFKLDPTDEWAERVYKFETDQGTKYSVMLDETEGKYFKLEGDVLKIDFGIIEDDTTNLNLEVNLRAVTNKGELYRVMNTVAEIIRKDIDQHKNIKYITFGAAKRTNKNSKSGIKKDQGSSNARINLYIKYVMGRLPTAKKIEDKKLNKYFPVLIQVR